MFIQFFIDLYETICNWFTSFQCFKEPLASNAEYFNYDDVYFSSNTEVMI